MCVNDTADTATQQTLVAFTELADQLASLHPLINNPWRAGMVSPINHLGRRKYSLCVRIFINVTAKYIGDPCPAPMENNLDSRVSVPVGLFSTHFFVRVLEGF